MDPQKNSSPLPGNDDQSTNPVAASTDAAPSPIGQEASSAEMPATPVAGQTIEPQAPVPGAGAAPSEGAGNASAPVDPSASVGGTASFPPVGPPKRRKKGLLIGLIVAAVVLLLSGGAAAAYFGYYVPNKPENVLKQALANSIDEAKAKTMQFTGEVAMQQPGFEDEFKVELEGAFDVASGAAKLQTTWDVAITELTFDMISVNGKTFYIKLGGLEGLGSFLTAFAPDEAGLDSYAAVIDSVNDQWMQINESMVKSVLGSDNASLALSSADRQAIAKAYTEHQFLLVKEVLPTASISGKESYHYRLTFDKDQFVAFNRALKDIDSSLFNADGATLEDLEQEMGKLDTSKFNIEVWISKKDKMFTQMLFAYEDSVSVRFTIESYNQPVKVQAPENAKSLLDVLGDLFSGFNIDPSQLTFPALEQEVQNGISL